MSHFAFYYNQRNKSSQNPGGYLKSFTPDAVRDAYVFHQSMPQYAPTPLQNLTALASEIKVAQFLVKDESKRFGLNAFKALGGSYAVARYLCDYFSVPMDAHTYQVFHSEQMREKIRDITFITATDGNHGRGLAWTAKTLGCKAIVYLPKGSSPERLDHILSLGAEAQITDLNYDDTVRYAREVADANGYVLIQDTAWEGYEKIPTAIMQGYTTMAQEICQQLDKEGWSLPTHLFLQAGVGAMAGAIAGFFYNALGENCPQIIIVEPDQADCIYRTASAEDGKLHIVTGDMNSMMAGLCCGEPCPIGWEVLEETAAAFISCDDTFAANGMRTLGRPFSPDPCIISGESGAVTAGVAVSLMKDSCPPQEALRNLLNLNENSRILVISTEGDTDHTNYLRMLFE